MYRIYYLTLPSLLDVSLCFAEEISKNVDFKMTLQVTSNNWRGSILGEKMDAPKIGLAKIDRYLSSPPKDLPQIWNNSMGFSIANFGGGNGLFPASMRTSLDVLKSIKDFKPDIIHLETTSGRLLWLLPEMRKIAPIVLTIHDPHPHAGEAPLKKLLIRSFTYKYIDRFIFHNLCQINEFCSEYKIPNNRVDYTPLGEYYLYRNFQQNRPEIKPNIVLFFGRLSPYKGLDILFEAMPLVCKRVTNVHFQIAGRPIPGFKLPAVPELEGGGKVEILQEYVNNEKMASLFQQAALVVCPYTDATQSGVIMTAYAFNKPIVASRIGGLPEYIEDGLTGRLVNPSDPVSLADGIVSMLFQMNDEIEGRQEIRESIRGVCKTIFNWRSISKQTYNIYQRTIDGHSTRTK